MTSFKVATSSTEGRIELPVGTNCVTLIADTQNAIVNFGDPTSNANQMLVLQTQYLTVCDAGASQIFYKSATSTGNLYIVATRK